MTVQIRQPKWVRLMREDSAEARSYREAMAKPESARTVQEKCIIRDAQK